MIFENGKTTKLDIEIECPRCGNKTKNLDNKCSNCGYVLREVKKQIDIEEENGSENDFINCPECGYQIFSDESECSYCGYKKIKSKTKAISENETDKKCFCCGTALSQNSLICPKCGADNKQLITSDTRNPNAHRYIDQNGNQFESNGFQIWGAVALISGLAMFLYFICFGADTGSIIASVVIACLGILLTIVGSYRQHQGKEKIKKDDDEKIKNDPNYKPEEIQPDIWDKIKNKLTSHKNSPLTSDNKKKELEELKEMYEENLITEEEYNKMRSSVISKYYK